MIRLLAAALVISALAGCAEGTPALNPELNPPTDSPPAARGVHKAGAAYQIDGVWYYPAEDWNYDETGIASWYGPGFQERYTANGEVYDQNDLTAAHKTLPLPSFVRVTNLDNGRSIVLRVNDRGPFARGRIIDVSRRSAQLLGFEAIGTAKVRVQIMATETEQLAEAMRARGHVQLARVQTQPSEPPPAAAAARPLKWTVDARNVPVPAPIFATRCAGAEGRAARRRSPTLAAWCAHHRRQRDLSEP